MAASRESTREHMTIERTPEDMGLILTIKVHAYDNGLLKVDGRPVRREDDWIGVGDLTALTLTTFHEEVGKRLAGKGDYVKQVQS